MTYSFSRPLVFGRDGQVAIALQSTLPNAHFLSLEECNLEDNQQVLGALNRYKPDLVINAAAYTEVDKAESDFQRAKQVNAVAPGEMAKWCADHESSLIHFSTDYVYAGDQTGLRSEESSIQPLNKYGESKWLGDQAIIESGCHHIILRTSWVFSPVGKNFLKTMLNIGAQRDVLKVVSDQTGSPTYAPDLARAVGHILNHSAFSTTSGVFHCVNSGTTTWHGFATAIFEIARELGFPIQVKEVQPVPTVDYPSPTRRPLNSSLDTTKMKSVFGLELPSWVEATRDCLEKLRA